MAKDKDDIKNKEMIGDPYSTEGSAERIAGAGARSNYRQTNENYSDAVLRNDPGRPAFKKENENFEAMVKRQAEKSNSEKPLSENKNPSISAIEKQAEKIENKVENPAKSNEIGKDQKPEKKKDIKMDL